jgi:hypothetical protein
MDIPQDIREAADITLVTQLILKERESRDLGRWDDMRACYFPDSRVRISWFNGSGPDFVKGSEDMARRKVLATHRLSPPRVIVNGERAIASFAGIIDIPVTIKGVAMQLASHARFLYRAERRGGTWGLVSFEAIYLRDELQPAIPGQSVSIDARELQAFRPSYRFLSYCLSAQGYTVDPDLPGEDRPEFARALLRELYDWVGRKRD